jgi:hypothetical protein
MGMLKKLLLGRIEIIHYSCIDKESNYHGILSFRLFVTMVSIGELASLR